MFGQEQEFIQQDLTQNNFKLSATGRKALSF